MLIEHISVSRSKTYGECPQRYKFHYHLRTPSPVPEPFYFVYGKVIHKMAETYVREKGERSLGDIASEVMRGKIEIEPGVVAPKKLPADYARKLPIHLASIQKLTDKIGCDGITEHPFYYDLEPPNSKFVKGFIDRLILKGNSAFIIDYKTTKKGKWRTNKETVKTDLQLRAYARVVQKEFGIAPQNIKCALYYVEDSELVAASYSEASLELAEKELLDCYNQIATHDVDNVRGTVGDHCTRCNFATLCPFYKARSFSSNWDGDFATLPGFNAR